MQTTDFNFEIRRKIFHLCGLIIPFFYLFVSKFTIILLLFPITICILYFDISRHYNLKIKKITNKLFSTIMRPDETRDSFKLSGLSYMMSSFSLTALFFPQGLAIASWLILIISDCLAALIGMKIGTPLQNSKSLAGSIAFLSSSIVVSILVYFIIGYNTSFLVIIITAIITTIFEFYATQLKINDNLLIPFSYCIFTIIFTFILRL